MNYVNVNTAGNAISFGSLTLPTRYGNAVGSRTRGVVYQGITPSINEDLNIQFYTFASTGSTIDFGSNSLDGRYGAIACSNATRAVRGGGWDGSANTHVMDYLTIASTGSECKDFGNLAMSFRYGNDSFANSTRGIMTGGYPGVSGGVETNIDFITISTQGNTADFGDLNTAVNGGSQGGCNATRGLLVGGHDGSSATNLIDYITMATLGDSIDFGDLLTTTVYGACAASKTRLVVAMGNYPVYVNTINFVEFGSLGDATDFGNLTTTGGDSGTHQGASNGHGGL